MILIPMRDCVKLLRLRLVRFHHATKSLNNKFTNGKDQNKKDFKLLIEEYKDEIVFSSYLDQEKLRVGYYGYYKNALLEARENTKKDLERRRLTPLPQSLLYYVEKDRLLQELKPVTETTSNKLTEVFQLPFANTTQLSIDEEDIEFECQEEIRNNDSKNVEDTEFDRTNIHKWMTNYEYFDDTKLEEDEEIKEETFESSWCEQYGSSDPSIPISSVPCGGCGALLHCNEPAIPGYLPSEIFKGRTADELKSTECQRCHFLKEYNVALDVNVQPEEYQKLLESVIKIKGLVLLLVDLLDFPCSIWPDIVDTIGIKRPIIIVANKVDLLPGDGEGYLQRVKESVVMEIKKTKLANANIKNIFLVSAKTGYGIEDLISTMFRHWQYGGNVCLVGCTNVGKSSLFNALLQSDFCKVQAIDIIKRATVSRWPGTTLNLLKFPINKPVGWKLQQRALRLKLDKRQLDMELENRKGQIFAKDSNTAEKPSLISYIGRTFSANAPVKGEVLAERKLKMDVFNEKHEAFINSRWCYDTPGIVHPDQVLSLLSTEELLLTIPKNSIVPQTYYLREGSTFFIGGLGRIDIIDCDGQPCRFTIFCSNKLPITVVKTENANKLYEKFIGTELFGVPCGNEERLKNWPGLQSVDGLEFTGEGGRMCCGDIVLSSIGWVSISTKSQSKCLLRAWTPEGRGIHSRCPALLPYSVRFKGRRLRDTPAYRNSQKYVEI